MSAASALAAQLAAAPVSALHRQRADGSRLIDALYAACSQAATSDDVPGLAGLALPPAAGPARSLEDLRARYRAVFECAITLQVGPWLLDYVAEVCGDPHLTSNDPLEAQLLDGAFVKEWCGRTLHAEDAKLQAWLKAEGPAGDELQRAVSKAGVLVSVLRALGRIHGAAPSQQQQQQQQQQQRLGGTPVQQGPASGVEAELSLALCLKQALQMLQWCVRHGLAGTAAAGTSARAATRASTSVANTGVHASMAEWLRRVQARRERRPGHGLFLDDMLQALHVPSGYPFASAPNAVYLLGCVVRDASEAARAIKLAVLAYYAMDLTGHASVGPDGSCCPLLADMAAAFHLPTPTVAAWQAAFLLDASPCAAQPPGSTAAPLGSSRAGALVGAGAEGGGDRSGELARACTLLVAHTQPDLPIKFIEVLVGVGRHDTALVVHRGQAVGREAARGMAALTAAQARTLMELRLRCGLLAEALHLVRAYVGALGDPSARRTALEVLLCALFEWAVAVQRARQQGGLGGEVGGRQQQQQPPQQLPPVVPAAGGGGGAGAAAATAAAAAAAPGVADGGLLDGQWARTALLELCFTEEEEEVLVAWLLAAAQQGRPCGDYLPLLLAARWRATEALGAFKVWADHRPSGAAAAGAAAPEGDGGSSAARAAVIDALVNTQARLLTLPQRNVSVSTWPGGELGAGPGPKPPLPAAIIAGLQLQLDGDAPLMHASFEPHQGRRHQAFITSA